MNPRFITASLSTVLASASLIAAEESVDIQPKYEPQINAVPVLKDVPILGQLFIEADPKKDQDRVLKVKEGTVTLKTDGGAKGKATVTIEINGKKEIREIDLGNATEIKIVSDDSTPTKTKRVTYLGVAPEELSEELASQLPIDPGSGLLVRSIIPDSPAATAGLLKNDVLVKLDDQVLTSPKQLQKIVAIRKPGDSVRVTYLRRGQQAVVEAKLAEHDDAADTKVDTLLNTLGWKHANRDVAGGRLQLDPLTFQKKIVIVDKEGNVVTKDDVGAEHEAAIKRLAAEMERMRDQATAAQKKAQEAIHHAEQAAREAAEIARKEASTAVDRMREAVRQLQEQLEKKERKEQ
jgi:hypothetical protein